MNTVHKTGEESKLPTLGSDAFMLLVGKKYDVVVIEDWRSAALRIYYELCQLKAIAPTLTTDFEKEA